MLSVVTQALKKPVIFLCMLCTPFANGCLVYSGWAFEITHHAYPNYHHLITAVSVIKRFSLYEFTLWGRDLVSIVRKPTGYLQAWPRIWTWDCREQIQRAVRAGLELASPTALTTRSRWVRSIQPKFPEISVQNSMDWFGPSGKVSKKLVHLLRWTTFPGRTGRNFGWMDRAHLSPLESLLHMEIRDTKGDRFFLRKIRQLLTMKTFTRSTKSLLP